MPPDRKSTRLNSSHPSSSYAVFCLKKKKNVFAPPLQMSRTSPAEFPASRCKSSFPPSSAHTSSTRRDPAPQTFPSCSSAPPGSHCTAAPAAHIRAFEKSPPASPIAPAAFHRSPAPAAISQSHENIPSSSPLFLFRRTPPALPVSPPLPDRDCSAACAAPLPAASPCTKFPSLAAPETVPSMPPLVSTCRCGLPSFASPCRHLSPPRSPIAPIRARLRSSSYPLRLLQLPPLSAWGKVLLIHELRDAPFQVPSRRGYLAQPPRPDGPRRFRLARHFFPGIPSPRCRPLASAFRTRRQARRPRRPFCRQPPRMAHRRLRHHRRRRRHRPRLFQRVLRTHGLHPQPLRSQSRLRRGPPSTRKTSRRPPATPGPRTDHRRRCRLRHPRRVPPLRNSHRLRRRRGNCLVPHALRAGSSRPARFHHLHFRHHRRAQGRHADAHQFLLQCRRRWCGLRPSHLHRCCHLLPAARSRLRPHPRLHLPVSGRPHRLR